MTAQKLPRLALSVLERFVPDSSSLAGDLAEEFRRRPSRAWLWWQVFAAIALAHASPRDEIRPLHLVDLQPSEAVERARRMSLRFPPINLAQPAKGIGGLGLVVLATVMTAVTPAAWALLLTSIFCGILLGLALIVLRSGHA